MLLQTQTFGAANEAEIAALDADFDAASDADFDAARVLCRGIGPNWPRPNRP